LVWDVYTGTLLGPALIHSRSVESERWSPDDRFVATLDAEGAVRVWSPESGTIVGRLLRHGSRKRGVQFAGDGSWLATLGYDRVRFWDLSYLSGRADPDLQERVQRETGLRLNRHAQAEVSTNDE